MVVALEGEDEDRLRRTTTTRTTTTNMTRPTRPTTMPTSKKMLSEAKQTPAEQLALLSRASGVQF